MEKLEKVYMSNQLCCMLPPLALKVMVYLLGWQNADTIKYYEKQFSKFLHLSVQELETAIQTLVDHNLVEVGKIDQTWLLNINRQTVKKYFDVPMQKVHDSEVFKLSADVTWNKGENTQQKTSSDIDDMTDEQLKTLLNRIQIMVSEREQTKKMVKMACAASSDIDDLPFQPMIQKRFQYWTREGKVWSEWFDWGSDDCPKVQLKGYKGNDLKNEYREC